MRVTFGCAKHDLLLTTGTATRPDSNPAPAATRQARPPGCPTVTSLPVAVTGPTGADEPGFHGRSPQLPRKWRGQGTGQENKRMHWTCAYAAVTGTGIARALSYYEYQTEQLVPLRERDQCRPGGVLLGSVPCPRPQVY